MYTLIDKSILFLCCTALLLFHIPAFDFYSVFLCLTAFVASCLGTFQNLDAAPFDNFSEHPIRLVTPSLYLTLCFLLPNGFLFLPLIFYDILFFKFCMPCIIGVLVCMLICVDLSAPVATIFFLLLLLCILLHKKSLRIAALEQQMKEIRDNGMELQLMLAQKNRDLLEKQDYEIHVATLKERNRIAREIHDNVGHMLSRSILQSGALIAVNHDEQLTGPLHALKDTLSSAMDSIRQSVHDLHDDSIDLKGAVTQILDNYTQYQIQFDYDMGRILPRKVKYCFISVTREALSNIVKHSNAERIEILMREQPRIYQLMIIDNGTNIAIEDSGIGLYGMKERIRQLDGTLTIHTENGFRIFISIPKETLS